MCRNFPTRQVWLAMLAAPLVCFPLAGARAGQGDDKKGSEEKQVQIVVTRGEDDQHQQVQIVDLALESDEAKPGKYWIGVLCSPLDDDLLKAQLDLDSGMVITKVLDDSPAANAGLQAMDIMIQVNEEPLDDLKDLAASIDKAGEDGIVLTIVRRGDRQEVKVKPAQRPVKFEVRQAQPDAEATKEWQMLQEALRKHGAMPDKEGEDSKDRDMSLMLVMPGVILPDQAENLPKDLEVTISKKGREEAKVTVKQGDQKWEVDAKSLDKLPDDIRPHIEKMLGHGHEMKFRFESDGFKWFNTLPKDLKTPGIIERSLQIAPDKIYQLHKLEPGWNKELQEKVQQRLKEANRALEEAKTKVPTEALERVEQELKILRKQIEQLRKEREKGHDGDED